MNAVTLRYLDDLACCIQDDPRVSLLASLEANLNEDPQAASLHHAMIAAQENYVLAKKDYGTESEEAKAAQKAFYQAKLALDECPSAKEYSALFSQLNFLYRELDDLLFRPFRIEGGCPHD